MSGSVVKYNTNTINKHNMIPNFIIDDKKLDVDVPRPF